MSTSFYAQAIVGVEIDVDKLIKIELSRKCRCKNKVDKTMKFCSGCGGKLWERDEINLNDFDYEKEFYCGMKIIRVYGYSRFDDEEFYHIKRIFLAGVGAETDDCCYGAEPAMCSLFENPSEIKDMLKETLEPKGLWDESKFGVWAIGKLS